MTDAQSDKIKVFHVSQWEINDDIQCDSVDRHILEVHASRARLTDSEAFCDSYAEALVELKRMMAERREENRGAIGACERRIAHCTQNIKTLNDFMTLINKKLAASEGQ